MTVVDRRNAQRRAVSMGGRRRLDRRAAEFAALRRLLWLFLIVVIMGSLIWARASQAEMLTVSLALPTETEDGAPLAPFDIDRADIVCRSAGATDVVATLREPLDAVVSIVRDFAPGVWTCVGTVRTGADQLFSGLSAPLTFTAASATEPPPIVVPPVARGRPKPPTLAFARA